VRYEGIVFVSGSTKGWADIEDLDVDEWRGTIREIGAVGPKSGLHTIRIAEGDGAGLFAVAEIAYDDDRRSGTLAGRTPFGPEPNSEPG
jgi:hypothetical protein